MTKKSFGALVLHGFTDSIDAVKILEQPLKALGLPFRMPILRGHGANSPEALRRITWHDWVTDSRIALEDLLHEVDKVILIGYSMGGLVALNLAADHPEMIDSQILAAAVVQINSPLAPGRPFYFLTPIVVRLIKNWDMPPTYVDQELAKNHNNYPWAPTDAIASLFEFSKLTRKRLDKINVPTLILQSHNDSTAAKECPEIIYNGIKTPKKHKNIIWFEKTEHEMFRDCERQAIVEVIQDYIKKRIQSKN